MPLGPVRIARELVIARRLHEELTQIVDGAQTRDEEVDIGLALTSVLDAIADLEHARLRTHERTLATGGHSWSRDWDVDHTGRRPALDEPTADGP